MAREVRSAAGGIEDLSMLSIGKLAAGQAKYYLDQAQGRVDVVESVGDGIEEYFFGPAEARGEWIGVAASELGLEGPVEATALRRVLGGLDPRDGSALRSSSSRTRVAGFDLTFSAPKSVSVLFGVGDAEVRGRVRAAHDRATAEALGYLERSVAAVRRGHGGAVVEEAPGLVAAAFRHRTSRAGDPQLHTHVLVANLGRGPDGRWSALDGRRLYAHARTASFVYQAVLRSEVTRTLGVEWTPVRKGIAEVVGIRRALLTEFSRRRAEIEAALAELGASGARAAEAAALATRQAKETRVGPDELVAEWRSRAAALGLGREEIDRILQRTRSVEPDAEALERAGDELAAATGLTRRVATFSRGDVVQALCEELPAGARVGARALELGADWFLAARAVPLVPDAEARKTGEAFRRRDGRLMPAATDGLRYSTPEQLAIEQRLIERVLGSLGAGVGSADGAAVDRALAVRPMLSDDQRRVVESLCLDGDGVAVVAGKAGTGKTFALAAAREAWQAAGCPVLGVATARRAAGELQAGAGIQSTSVAALLAELRLDVQRRLPERCVLVVDEAGMVATRELSELLEHVGQAHGKLVLVGDHRQLPEIGAGGAFRGLVQRGLAVELGENLRQVNTWEREALDHLLAGRPEQALRLYTSHNRVVVEPTGEEARERLVRDWLEAGDLDGAVMIAQRRADVTDLNARARERLKRTGAVAGPERRLLGRTFAVGDRVVAKLNDSRLGVHNGQRGQIVAIDAVACSLALRSDDRTVELDWDYLLGVTQEGDPTLVHGYAITGHVAQGLTVDRSFVLADEALSREWAYVALSRGRQSNRLYLAAERNEARAEFAPVERRTADPIDRLAAALRSSDAQAMAIDTGRPHLEPAESAAQARLEAAECALRDASQERRALEARRHRWLPGRRDQLAEARQHEHGARRGVVDARRAQAEVRHGAQPFIAEQEHEALVKSGSSASPTGRRSASCIEVATLDASSEVIVAVPRTPARPVQPVPRYTLTRREAAASLGVSINHFERKVQPELKVVLSGQLVLIPVTELERWVQRHARATVDIAPRPVPLRRADRR